MDIPAGSARITAEAVRAVLLSARLAEHEGGNMPGFTVSKVAGPAGAADWREITVTPVPRPQCLDQELILARYLAVLRRAGCTAWYGTYGVIVAGERGETADA